jgi:hypothetical protein
MAQITILSPFDKFTETSPNVVVTEQARSENSRWLIDGHPPHGGAPYAAIARSIEGALDLATAFATANGIDTVFYRQDAAGMSASRP